MPDCMESGSFITSYLPVFGKYPGLLDLLETGSLHWDPYHLYVFILIAVLGIGFMHTR